MRRRDFLAAGACATMAPALLRAADALAEVKVTRIIGFDVVSRRSKIAGKNSRLDVHGDRATDRMARIMTDAGIEGVGNCRANEEQLQALIGKNVIALHQRGGAGFAELLGAGTMPLWDIVGKALNEPVYKLLGGAGPERVPVYDGSIYFADLLPQYANNWADRFREEIDMGRKLGHRAFKVKIGRGAKWMPRAAGDARDLEVLRTIRRHGGPELIIGVDANNGYDLAGAKRLLAELPDYNFAFTEEMFPETVQQCLEYKQFIAARGWKTLLADGETQGELEAFRPFIDARAIDVLQGDMNRFGFEGILTEADWARPQGILVAPHNWGSLVGYYMQLHVGRAITNFYRAEHDPLANDILIADGYAIEDGLATVPDAPGFGLEINEERFASEAKVRFDLRG